MAGWRALLRLLALGSVVLGLAACGSSSKTSSTASTATSGASGFVSTANSICTTYGAKAAAVPRPSKVSGLTGYLNQVLPVAQQELAKLKALSPPSNQQAAYQRFLSLSQRQLVLTQQALVALNSGDNKKAALLIRREQVLSARGNAAARTAGLVACAR